MQSVSYVPFTSQYSVYNVHKYSRYSGEKFCKRFLSMSSPQHGDMSDDDDLDDFINGLSQPQEEITNESSHANIVQNQSTSSENAFDECMRETTVRANQPMFNIVQN